MKKLFDFTITEKLRIEYDKFLRGKTSYKKVRKKYGITHYQITKLFNIMYMEKRNNSTPVKL